MNQRTLDILEYPRIREDISGFCMSAEGQAALLALTPFTEAREIEARKALSSAWMKALIDETPPTLPGWPPVGPFLSRLRVEGASLSLGEFHALGLFCESAAALSHWARTGRRFAESTDPDDSALREAILSLGDLAPVSSEIFRIVDKSTGEIRDLSELKAIKESIRKIRGDIERLVGRYLSDESCKSMLQSNLPTLRDGRQVIALRANFRGRIKGIVHEVSQSGQTVYLEPEDVVDRNNDLVSEEHRLSREIARILKELTARLAPSHEVIADTLSRLVFLDGINAGSRWGVVNKCVFASVERPNAMGGALQLKQARHPLLKAKAVPIDLVLAEGTRMVIITGPNTGGKTVALKTAALLALMNQSGWPVPAAEGTVLPVFDSIGCDIGDEQSIDQSLSTFSAHMKNVAGILRSAGERSLVLLDELGSGTDPHEGSAIAMSVLDTLLERGSLVLVTTHHGILKNYGYTHEACVNASVDFDQNTLSPTYRILMGVPGESHALDIAARNGLDPQTIEQARSYLNDERADVSALIKGLTAKHEQLSKFEEEKKKEEQALREKRRKTDLKELQLRQKELELREQGYRRLERMFDESRKQLENLVRELREGELTREKTLQVKAWMDELDSRVSAEHDSLVAERRETEILKISDRAEGKSVEAVLCEGMEVYIEPSRRRGVLVREDKKGKWIVSTGTLKMTVDEKMLSPVPAGTSASKVSIEIHTAGEANDIPVFELRLLGLRHDEAMKALERQLDLAAMKGLKEFSIVHGKGHGILQKAVHDALKRYAGVSDFRFARPEDGGTGKTYVTLG